MVTLHGLTHCATEITTEPSKSSCNALTAEKEERRDNKGATDIHRHEARMKSKAVQKKDQFSKSFMDSVISGVKFG